MAQNYPVVRLQREQTDGKRIKGNPPKGTFATKRTAQEQSSRHSGTFNEIAQNTKNIEEGIDVSDDPRAVTPDRALVVELLGRVASFEAEAQKLGFEWLTSEYDSSAEEDADEQDGKGESFLYLTMPTLSGLKTLLARWRTYKSGKAAPSKADAVWWKLFGLLKDIRVWSAKDRIDPSVSQYIDMMLSGAPDTPVVMEIDLWYRNETERRDRAYQTLQALLKEVGGRELDFISIPEINYQAALVEVPAEIARKLAKQEGKLAYANEIMTIRPQSLYQANETSTGNATQSSKPTMLPIAAWAPQGKQPIAAILDGYPVQGHVAIGPRVVIHEVDVQGVHVPVAARKHGTAMASLVLHGDLHQPLPPLDDPVVIVPVLSSGASQKTESTPAGKLPIGMIYRAVKSLVTGPDGSKQGASEVVLINHSICDTYAPFVRRPTPWAVLLDHLAHRHRLLFIISAGNIDGAFPLDIYADNKSFSKAPALEREANILEGIEKAKGLRSILSPAESINGLTVGALHGDEGAPSPIGVVDPYPSVAMTNIGSALGLGVRRGIKPDLVEFGGRQSVIVSQEASNIAIRATQTVHMGQMVAAPDTGGDLSKIALSSGTSNAAALVTRAGIVTAQAVSEIFRGDKVNWRTSPTRAVILKALLAHGARWGAVGTLLNKVYPPADPKRFHARKETIAKFLGYGQPQPEFVINGNQSRITLLGSDVIKHDELHEYRVPVPSGMLNNREVRRIIVTLAWTSPVSVTSDTYRGVALKIVDEGGKKKFWEGVSTTLQPNMLSMERGTLTHLVLEGKNKIDALANTHGIFIGVQAYANRKNFEAEKVPYAIAITLEMGQSLKSSGLYVEIRDAIQERARTRAQARTGV